MPHYFHLSCKKIYLMLLYDQSICGYSWHTTTNVKLIFYAGVPKWKARKTNITCVYFVAHLTDIPALPRTYLGYDHKCKVNILCRRTEVVVPGRTRNAFVEKSAREFESHRLRQTKKTFFKVFLFSFIFFTA